VVALVLIAIAVSGYFLYMGLYHPRPPSPPSKTLVVISIDGFRWDYLDMYKDKSPYLNQLADGGVRADYMKPIFPSKTFPNHWTIMTGIISSFFRTEVIAAL